ncbi:S-layer homology domain-containing protein [Demequina sp.]|uniref:S-layer homology domain-containing protein n=1 Tax=Demequina sp. TaxID=2050685 RepID=UPI003D0CEB57
MRIWRAAAVTTTVMALLLGGVSIPASAATTGKFSINVTDENGDPADGGCLKLTRTSGSGPTSYSDCTSSAGTYAISGIALGGFTYKVSGFPHHVGTASGSVNLTTVWPTASLTDTVTAGPVVKGTVKSSDGAPLANAVVTLYSAMVTSTPLGAPIATGTTDANGVYRIQLNTSSWVNAKVTSTAQYGSAWTTRWYASTGDGAAVKNFTLAPVGSLTGVLSVPPRIEGDDVCLHALPERQNNDPALSVCGEVDSAFSLDVAPGTYYLCLGEAPASAPCTVTWRGPDSPYGGGGAVTVASAATRAVDLQWGGTHEHTVKLNTGEALDGGCLTLTLSDGRSTSDCSPSDGRFDLAFADDVYDQHATFALEGANNAFDATWDRLLNLSGGSVSTRITTVNARGTGQVNVAVARDDHVAITGGCVALIVEGSFSPVATDCTITDGIANFSQVAPARYIVKVTNVPGSLSEVYYPAEPSSRLPRTAVTVTNDAVVDLAMSLPTHVTITGRVTSGGSPRSDGTVQFLVGDAVVAEATPGSDGNYSFVAPIVPGKLRVVGFDDSSDAYFGGAYTAASSSQVGGPSLTDLTLSGRDFSLSPAATLRGVIEAPDGIAPADACVRAAVSNSVTLFGPPVCGSVGDPFEIPVVAGKSYVICVSSVTDSELCGTGPTAVSDYVGRDAWETEFVVPASGGEVAVVLAFGGTLHVSQDTDGGPVHGGCATLYESGEETQRSCDPVDGVFSFTLGHDSTPGQFAASFAGVSGAVDTLARTVPQVYGGGEFFAVHDATPWPVLVGTITRPAGLAATHACVYVENLEGLSAQTCLEPGVDAYKLSVPPGFLAIQFYVEEDGAAFEYYKDAATLDAATRVRIVIGETKTVNATLAPEGRIVGHVTVAGGSPGLDGCAGAYGSDGVLAQVGCVDENGDFVIGSLPAGTYRVKFWGFDGSALRWYSSGSDYGTAKPLTVKSGVDTVANATLIDGSVLAGAVTYKGAPAVGGCVEVWALSGYFVDADCSISAGEYAFTNLPAGTYKIYFTGFDGAGDLYFGGSSVFESAASVRVSTASVTNANIALGDGGSIAGTAYAESMSGETFTVGLYDPAGNLVAAAPLTTYGGVDEELGHEYKFEHVPAGTYKIGVTRDSDGFFEWRRGAGTFAPESIVMPTGSSWDITGKNLPDLSALWGGAVSGSLNVPATWKSSTICAVAVRDSGTVDSADCGPRGGAFTLTRLNSGYNYAIVFTNGDVRSSAAYKAFKGSTKWFGNASSRTSAPYYHLDEGQRTYFPVWFFKDVTYKTSNFWAISWMGDQGITTGYSDGSFKPTATLSRVAFATYLYKLAGSPSVTLPAKSPFKYVKSTDSGYKALVWLYNSKISTSTTFKASDPVTRSAEAVMLYRYAGKPAITLPSKSPYSDVKKSTSETYKAIVWAKSKKVMGAVSGTSFRPSSTVSRQSGAAHLYNYWWYVG